MRTLVVLAVLLAARPAGAVEYTSFLTIRSEDDLLDRYEDGQLSEPELDALIGLVHDGVDLRHADRATLYQLPNLSHADVDAVLAFRRAHPRLAPLDLAAVLPAAKLSAILPFLRAPDDAARPLSGELRAPLVVSVDPSFALRAEVRRGAWRAGGALVVTRLGVDQVVHDPARDALSAAPAGRTLHLPRAFVAYRGEATALVLGSYRAGFGERLTFDNQARRTPEGFHVDDQVDVPATTSRACVESAGELDASPCDDRRVPADLRWRQGLRGVAASWRGPAVRLTGFASLATRPASLGDLVDGGEAVLVYRRGEDPLAPSTRYTGVSLPDMFRETTLGGHARLGDDAGQLGLTAYASRIDWLVRGAELDFAPSGAYPRGPGFAAVGVDGSLALAGANLAGEVARSFDAAGGGPAVLVRGERVFAGQALELSARWYAAGFANPYARPVAAADQEGGLRARDEAGLRVDYRGGVGALALGARVDGWTRADLSSPAVAASARATLRLSSELEATLLSDDEVNVALAASLVASRALRLSARAGRASAFAAVVLRLGALVLRGRMRWSNPDSSAAATADLTFRSKAGHGIRIRYDALVHIDGAVDEFQQGAWLEASTEF